MNIRDNKTYIVCLLQLMLWCALTSCHREDLLQPLAQHTTYPIELLAKTEWNPIAKATLMDDSELQKNGFVVWANWAKDPNDNALFTGNYSTGNTNLVFGNNGTKVTRGSDGWSYTPKRYWYRGTYNFGAVAPANVLASSYPENSSGIQGSILENAPTLNLNFGNDGFDLSKNQTDIVVAFATVDNTKEDVTNSVSLEMKHQLSLLNLQVYSEVENTSFTIEKVEIFGNYTTARQAQFTKTNNNIIATWDYNESKTEAFIIKQGSWSVTNTSTSQDSPTILVEDLIVFPEANANKDVTIKVTCKETYNATGVGESITKIGIIKANWLAGNTYTYLFSIDRNSIIFREPTVSQWDNNGGSIGNITM